MNYADLTIGDLLNLIEQGEVKKEEVLSYFLARQEKWEEKLNSFIWLNPQKEPGNTTGIPVGVKDNIVIKGIPATCGSKILKNYIPPYSATAWKRLEEKGFFLAGKTNMDEFAMGSSTEHSAFGPARNPWDLSRVPGGSSGGSAAAVAADLVKVALGSDTGGSVRQPAAFCGIVGFKPTYGRISRYGLVAFASSLDQIGILSKWVVDAAFLFSLVAGYDPMDSTSAKVKVPSIDELLGEKLDAFTFAYPSEKFLKDISPEIKKAFKEFIELLESTGGKGEEVDLSILERAIEAYYILAPAEASSNLARYDGVRYGYRASTYNGIEEMYMKTREEGFGQEVKRRIILGTFVLSSGYYDDYYGKALAFRKHLARFFDNLFSRYRFVVLPTTPGVAFKLKEKQDPISMYLEDLFTIPANLAGIPAISIPFKLSDEGLPIGMQIIASWFDEKGLFSLARLCEDAIKFNRKYKLKEAHL